MAGGEKGRFGHPHGERAHHPDLQARRPFARPRLPGCWRRAGAKLPKRGFRREGYRGMMYACFSLVAYVLAACLVRVLSTFYLAEPC